MLVGGSAGGKRRRRRKSGREGMEKLAAGEVEKRRGRGFKRCRSSSSSTPPRSLEREDRERTPCLISYHTNGFGLMLYAIDFDEKGCNKERNFCKRCRIELFTEGDGGDLGGAKGKEHDGPPLRRISLLKLGWFPCGKMFVALGSTVYVLGGEDEGFLSHDVYYFETANVKKSGGAEADGGWKQGPKMLSARCRGGALAVFFGGLPIAAYGSPSDTKIMFSGKATHCAYHVKSGTWEQLAWFVCSCGRKPFGVGNCMYYTWDGYLIAANTNTRWHFQGKIKGSRFEVGKGLCGEPRLVHLGGKDFCFFTLEAGRRSSRTKPLALTGHGLLLDGIPVRIKDDEVEEEVAGEVSRKLKVRNNVSTNIMFEEVDDEVEGQFDCCRL
ncbi:hypothetical protein RHMOL_Rhmol02G0063800 [Rhododendron molle]|uniref:Uncharacterized protein n=1 Tax=Rhododendron molle TaxID=49168 RepID=A0ACC0PNH2_RHOML|nr:hypothetical protein RHMOL_Rhmol02G0063800 [Rhododendron molle]